MTKYDGVREDGRLLCFGCGELIPIGAKPGWVCRRCGLERLFLCACTKCGHRVPQGASAEDPCRNCEEKKDERFAEYAAEVERLRGLLALVDESGVVSDAAVAAEGEGRDADCRRLMAIARGIRAKLAEGESDG